MHMSSRRRPARFARSRLPRSDWATAERRPVGVGGYLRLLPYCYTAAGIRRVNRTEGKPACVYFHPWEIDPGQPRLASGWIARMRTYGGLGGMERKLEQLLSDFRFGPMTGVVEAG